jgi:hypothetical protein
MLETTLHRIWNHAHSTNPFQTNELLYFSKNFNMFYRLTFLTGQRIGNTPTFLIDSAIGVKIGCRVDFSGFKIWQASRLKFINVGRYCPPSSLHILKFTCHNMLWLLKNQVEMVDANWLPIVCQLYLWTSWDRYLAVSQY